MRALRIQHASRNRCSSTRHRTALSRASGTRIDSFGSPGQPEGRTHAGTAVCPAPQLIAKFGRPMRKTRGPAQSDANLTRVQARRSRRRGEVWRGAHHRGAPRHRPGASPAPWFDVGDVRLPPQSTHDKTSRIKSYYEYGRGKGKGKLTPCLGHSTVSCVRLTRRTDAGRTQACSLSSSTASQDGRRSARKRFEPC